MLKYNRLDFPGQHGRRRVTADDKQSCADIGEKINPSRFCYNIQAKEHKEQAGCILHPCLLYIFLTSTDGFDAINNLKTQTRQKMYIFIIKIWACKRKKEKPCTYENPNTMFRQADVVMPDQEAILKHGPQQKQA